MSVRTSSYNVATYYLGMSLEVETSHFLLHATRLFLPSLTALELKGFILGFENINSITFFSYAGYTQILYYCNIQ